MTKYQEKVMADLERINTLVSRKSLALSAKIKKTERIKFSSAIDELIKSGVIVEIQDKLVLKKSCATIVKVNETFGFARLEDEPKDIFIPGKFLKGTMPGDCVVIKVNKRSDGTQDGEVTDVVSYANKSFTGIVQKIDKQLRVVPDRDIRFPLSLKNPQDIKEGDKVVCNLVTRGKHHKDHKVSIQKTFGRADSAKVCCEAILAAADIFWEFPDDVSAEAVQISEGGIHPKEISCRLDLRGEMIFTIDGADTKDIDDAVSLVKKDDGWELGVHIADVSYYVSHDSPLDQEAFKRGTSVYFADSVIPMLPKELSNGICSLNPNEDRLALSAFVLLDENANIVKYKFKKTVICSKVKGVYSEINSLFNGSASEEIEKKYAEYKDTLSNMFSLAHILTKKRFGRGALNLESSESKIIIDDNGKAYDVVPRERGESERVIEEFMLIANEATASFAIDKHLPFLYRTHENPDPKKLLELHDILAKLGIKADKVTADTPSSILADILDCVRGTDIEKVVNNTMLHSMAKAKYTPSNIGHYGLVLDNYSHFTSPIRRYPDLVVHRILTGYLTGMKFENIIKRYTAFVGLSGKQSTSREILAMQISRECENSYKAEYMASHVGEKFTGIISGVTSHGIYVELENTVEGMIKIDSAENIEDKYRIGDKAQILVLSADVSLGQINFAFIEN